MKIEIWSDIMCPFCYIGKRHLALAMEGLTFKNEVEIFWKSYQLNPDYHNKDGENVYQYLSRSKGISESEAKALTGNVVNMAKNAGLTIDFETSIPANSFDAHRLLHFAKTKGLQNEAKEALFSAHFVKGLDIANRETLVQIGASVGLIAEELQGVLESAAYAEAVNYDIYEARQIGVRGVPFFVVDQQLAIYGAQPVSVIQETLTKAYEDWSKAGKKNEDASDSSSNACNDDFC